MRPVSRWLRVGFALGVILVGGDTIAKRYVRAEMSAPSMGAGEVCVGGPQRVPRDRVTWIHGVLEVRYAENCGAAFGLMRGASALVRHALFGLAALLVIAWLTRLRGGPRFQLGAPLLTAGAAGNLVDRATLGHVVDYLHVPWLGATINVADVAVALGVLLLITDIGHTPTTAPPSDDSG